MLCVFALPLTCAFLYFILLIIQVNVLWCVCGRVCVRVCVCVCFVGVPIVSGESGYRGSLNVLAHSPANQ